MSIIIKQSEIDNVSCVIESEGGTSRVISYRYYSDTKARKVPNYIKEGDNYIKIEKGGVVDRDNGLYTKKRGKGYMSDHKDYTMIPYQESKRKSIIASCST